VTEGSYFVPDGANADGAVRVVATSATASPWSAALQHGGPPSALLTHLLEQDVLPPGQTIARISFDLLGPVPVGPLSARTEVLRSGRSVQLLQATLRDDDSGRDVLVARAWCAPDSDDGPVLGEPAEPSGRVPSAPGAGEVHDAPPAWGRGYLDSVDWRWLRGSIGELGPATAWLRPRPELLPGIPLSPRARLVCAVDSASGVSAALDIAHWDFLNTDLTVHLLREPVGEWVCLDARTSVAGGATGVATARVFDERGLVAVSAQALLVTRRASERRH
jgi:acyl-coenzyme A thioesterase PaaI-like protein